MGEAHRFRLLILAALALCCSCIFRSSNSAREGTYAPLRVRYLGVGGFLIEHGQEAVLTAPLFTRPSWLELSTTGIASNPQLVDFNLPPPALANVRAVISGHAHYDHLLDVPTVMTRAPQATLFSNRSARNILTAFAPDRHPKCASVPHSPLLIPRHRVVAFDDLQSSAVDYSFCPHRRPPNAPIQGRWLGAPGSHIRIFAVCSEHPDQLGPIHYAPGGVEEEQCAPPPRAADWLEGNTLAYVIDFLDPLNGRINYRVYYQDSPTNAPVGHVPEPLLREKRVDLALLCIGAYDRVIDHPSRTIAGLAPRYVIGAHWEDFGRSLNEPIQPIPLLDLATWDRRARASLPARSERPMLKNGFASPERFAIPRSGETFEIGP